MTGGGGWRRGLVGGRAGGGGKEEGGKAAAAAAGASEPPPPEAPAPIAAAPAGRKSKGRPRPSPCGCLLPLNSSVIIHHGSPPAGEAPRRGLEAKDSFAWKCYAFRGSGACGGQLGEPGVAGPLPEPLPEPLPSRPAYAADRGGGCVAARTTAAKPHKPQRPARAAACARGRRAASSRHRHRPR